MHQLFHYYATLPHYTNRSEKHKIRPHIKLQCRICIHRLYVIGCLDPVGLSPRPSWSIDFGHVSETNGWEYSPKMTRLRQTIGEKQSFGMIFEWCTVCSQTSTKRSPVKRPTFIWWPAAKVLGKMSAIHLNKRLCSTATSFKLPPSISCCPKGDFVLFYTSIKDVRAKIF